MRFHVKVGSGMVVALALCASVLVVPAGADTDAELKKLPGYVEFSALKVFKDQEARIEVYLKDPMLQLVSGFVKTEDPELYDILAKLKLVRVQIYDVTIEQAAEVARISSETGRALDARGWERIVRVRDEGEHADVYLKPAADFESIDGIVIMVVDDENEAIFVNIVGSMRPEDIGRLGDHLDIDELDGLDYKPTGRKK